jgi:ATP/maltotriose-dependent transcriptional regulator MalT
MLRANVAENRGDVASMRASIDLALAAFERLGERWGLASCLQMVGLLNTNDGDLDAAVANYHEALRLVGEMGAHDDAAWLHLRLADVHIRRGDLTLAADLARRGNAISEAAGSNLDAVYGWVLMAEIARRNGDLDAARLLRDDALVRLAAMPPAHPLQGHGVALTMTVAAKHELFDGEVETAREHVVLAYEAGLGTRDMPVLASVGVTTALFAEHDGDPVTAAERLRAAAQLRGTEDPTQPDIVELTTRLRAELGDAGFEPAYGRGRALDREVAIESLRPRFS